MADEKIKFTVDSQLLSELGEKLVTRNYIALAELIKNSYDADANEVTVRFTNAKKGGIYSEIEIMDDGHGMNFEAVKERWMRIATAYKVHEPISPKYGRPKTGNKGLGRFACRRLAKNLSIETTAQIEGSDDLESTKVFFNWDAFIPGTMLTDIPCRYETREVTSGRVGTILKLTDLQETWSESDFNLAVRQVLSLSISKGTRRVGYVEDPGFEIALESDEFPKGEGYLADKLMDAGWGKLHGEVIKGEACRLLLEAKDIGAIRYDLTYEPNVLEKMEFDIAWIPGTRDYFRNTKILTVGVAQKIMPEQSGVRVYLDDFRVYPYGSPNNDWLGIDADVARRLGRVDQILDNVAEKLGVNPGRAMLNHPRNRNLIGKIYLRSGPDFPFAVKLDREGFIPNEAYDELVKIIRLSLQWMVLQYNKFLMQKSVKELQDVTKRFESMIIEENEDKRTYDIDSSVSVALTAVDLITSQAIKANQALPEEGRQQFKDKLLVASDVVKSTINTYERYQAVLQGVASTGNLMFNFSHEVKNLISRLDTHANTINRIADRIPLDVKEDFLAFAKSLHITRDRLDQQIKLFGTLSDATASKERKNIPLKLLCKEIKQGFEYLIKEYAMNDIQINVSDTLTVGPILEVQLYSVLVNLISNSIKANLAGYGKNISIDASKSNSKTVIKVYDDGIGLNEEYRHKVFQPLNADASGQIYSALKDRIGDSDLAALGRGSGIGLNIVKHIVEEYKGSVQFVDTDSPWKTCIEVIL